VSELLPTQAGDSHPPRRLQVVADAHHFAIRALVDRDTSLGTKEATQGRNFNRRQTSHDRAIGSDSSSSQGEPATVDFSTRISLTESVLQQNEFASHARSAH
jgi:hypothetical protein